MSEGLKDFVAALRPLSDRIGAVERFVDHEVMPAIERRAGSGISLTHSQLPERAQKLVEPMARRGRKDPAKAAAMEAWLRNACYQGAPGYAGIAPELRQENDRLAEVLGGVPKAYLNENTPSQGAYTVPVEIESEIFKVLLNVGVFRGAGARIVPINSKTLQLNSILTNCTTYVVAELGSNITAGEYTLGTGSCSAYDFVAYGEATLDVLADSASSLLDTFLVNAAEQIGRAEDSYAMNGTAGDMCLGIAGQNTTNAYTIGSIFRTDCTTATNAPTSPTLVHLGKCMYGPKHFGVRQSGAWIMHPMTWANCISQTSSSVPIFPDANRGFQAPQSAAAAGNLYGYPVYLHDGITNATEGTLAYFGNWRDGFVIGDRTGIDFQVSPHYKFQAGLLAMRLIKRTAMRCVQPHALSALGKTLAT